MLHLPFAAAGLSMALAMASPAFAEMPSGIGQFDEAVNVHQPNALVQTIHWRRHHDRNHLRFFFGQQPGYYDYQNYGDPYFYQRHRRHFDNRRFYSNSYFPDYNREFQPNFGFSIGF